MAKRKPADMSWTQFWDAMHDLDLLMYRSNKEWCIAATDKASQGCSPKEAMCKLLDLIDPIPDPPKRELPTPLGVLRRWKNEIHTYFIDMASEYNMSVDEFLNTVIAQAEAQEGELSDAEKFVVKLDQLWKTMTPSDATYHALRTLGYGSIRALADRIRVKKGGE